MTEKMRGEDPQDRIVDWGDPDPFGTDPIDGVPQRDDEAYALAERAVGSAQAVLDATRPPREVKRGYCDHCGAYGDLAAVWNRGVAVEFKWLCPRDEALAQW